MVRDANLDIGTHTTVFVVDTIYSADVGSPLDLGKAGLTLSPSLQGQVFCTEPAAVREVTFTFKVRVDGANYKPLGEVVVPAAKAGRFASNIGRELKSPWALGANSVEVICTVSAPANASVDNGTYEIGLGFGEGSQAQQ